MLNNEVINWLLEDNNPIIKYRTQTEILGENVSNDKVKEYVFSFLPDKWYEMNGLWYTYYITAIALSGLKKDDIPLEYISKALDTMNNCTKVSCEDFMLFTSLALLGYDVSNVVEALNKFMLPDGGFLCDMKLKKFSYVPKSCYKANIHALMFLSACYKQKISINNGKQLIEYFLKRNIVYKSDLTSFVINEHLGWRTVDVFFPYEVMRVGIINVVEAIASLGYGNDIRMKDAWDILEKHKDSFGKVILDGTLTKSYLPKEKVGKPSKWATFYSILSELECKY